ncbi:CaiB/BaiF family protein [Arthrobacter globiformis NBRC 12137]|uniref:CaiB/BaiF family protein n=1 Tax=Arthrobacter globiformis (strain ATCC 8010 / DSM 20124 / JCM 1332 / NBRC 12137 / NCIMB 8907 / NRRL B-2979 / 168) TaxID=1077972 RepID=H0QSV8_ARTG1|nr:CaiB/BaiF CoA-transferase family protein [Arthrobacter globiformis]GAB15909.1 CaiB/BaiF family protein [Arthrobacter globiformis NBRC 12137]
MAKLPLAGLTVVSLEQAVAAPFATRQLADLGARVIKVERDTGDFARGYDRKVNGMSSYFVWLNRGKESIVLDLKSDEGLRALKELVLRADVLVQNLAPGAVERLGLGPDDALALNPRLVHVSISGYGRGGSHEQKKAYDLLIQCEAGLLSVTGTPDSPAKVGVSIADICAGMYAYSGVLTSLLQRATTGRGDVLEVSMLEALGEWMSQPYFYAEYGGAPPVSSGAQHASIAPYGPFATADGTVFFGIQNEREWAIFCAEVLGQPGLAADPRFSTNTLRVENRAELHASIHEVLGSQTTDDAVARLDAANIANAQLRDMHGFSAHPQLEERNRWREVESPVGPLRSLIPPVTSREAGFRMGPVPELGEHTAKILAELGVTAR